MLQLRETKKFNDTYLPVKTTKLKSKESAAYGKLPQVPGWYDALYYNRHLRLSASFLFSAGKIFQAAGQDILGIIKILHFYKIKNPVVVVGTIVFLTTINVGITLSTRASKIFEYFLLPTLYLTKDIPHSNSRLMGSYALDIENLTLYIINAEGRFIKIAHTEDQERKLRRLCLNIFNDPGLLKLKRKNLKPISRYFSPKQFRLFSTVLASRELEPDWLPGYYFVLVMCYISTIFSGMSAYLFGVTLLKAIAKIFSSSEIPLLAEVAFGAYVMICAIVAYFTFNLSTMKRNVISFFHSINDWLNGKGFGIQPIAMRYTIGCSLLGVIAGAGMSYFSTENVVDIFPGNQYFSMAFKESIILLSAEVSIFPSVFNFAAGCYDQMKKLKLDSPAENRGHYAFPTCATFCALLSIFIDSAANAFGSFLGTLALLSKYVFSGEMQDTALSISIIIYISNVFLNFGMSMTGSEKMIQWLNNIFSPSVNVETRAGIKDATSITPLLGLDKKSSGFSENLSFTMFSDIEKNLEAQESTQYGMLPE